MHIMSTNPSLCTLYLDDNLLLLNIVIMTYVAMLLMYCTYEVYSTVGECTIITMCS